LLIKTLELLSLANGNILNGSGVSSGVSNAVDNVVSNAGINRTVSNDKIK